ncbi:MAG TPA: hypothetical protein VK635_28520 [Bradyrhizobium sp.]|nr:hypothetical protein [Bradyrhizobium sp.]
MKAFADLDASEFHGARAHLRNAASHLTAGNFADSVRESIHAVESVSRTLDASADLSKALAKLEQKISIHAAMKKGFTSLYGYASDENGIRHALLEAGEAKVAEADALFMIGACAAFVSYLLNKARTNGSFVRGKLVVHHSDFDVLIPSHSRIGKLSGGTRISMLLGTPG